ncbi:TonB-dependent receptor [Pseudoalteromonas sp. SR45-6]|uniref:TonB-dependent receptor n=1 Tax=Pseudoalteromonas sp. SR45-6 TaxID=2760927 RepID=UPI001602CCC1|nr:TonB-dependent receptor [Pseudoalteromonas sp. SR45-6]MBB1341988.1 TonB-dependent receptor [Pseudoalteromonas sp. SR45-6]
MLAKNFKKSLLAVNIGLVMSAGFTGAVYAADEVKVQEDVEVIEVRGIRRSLEASINTKRFADGVVDAVSAEDIGKFPDSDVGEALGRIPGVAVNRQFGQGQQVSIRGASNQLTLTTLNGQNVASTGWYDQQAIDRSFNYTLLPPQMISEIKVYKSSQADLLEGGVGGSVDVITRKPLDLDSGTAFISAEGTYSTASSETDPAISGLYSWKNDEETFGVLAAVAWEDTTYVRRGNEASYAWAGAESANYFEQNRERTAVDFTAQYSPTDNMSFALHYMNLDLSADNNNNSLFVFSNTDSCSQFNDAGACLVRETNAANPAGQTFLQTFARFASMNSETIDLSFDYVSDNFKLETQIGTTKAEGGTDLTLNHAAFIGFPEDVYGTIDATGEYTDIDIAVNGWNENDIDTVWADRGLQEWATQIAPNEDKETYFQTDLTLMLDSDFITSVKTGVRWSNHEVTRESLRAAQGAHVSVDPLQYWSGTDTAGMQDLTIPLPNINAMKANGLAAVQNWYEDRSGFGTVEEENLSVYVMANFSGEAYRGNFGVRYVSTYAESDFYAPDPTFVDPNGIAQNNGLSSTIDTDQGHYSELLPSFNLAYDINQDTILRFSIAQVISRPNYSDMFASQSLAGYGDTQLGNQSVTKGSPSLSPFKATQADIGFEYYYGDSNLVAVTAFYKDVSNFTTSETLRNQKIGITDPVCKCDDWTVNTQVDGDGGEIAGVEFQIQHALAGGFGTMFNYTFADSSADPDNFSDGIDVFTDSSEHTVNAVGYYENDDVSVRLAYNWRSEYMIRETGFYGNRWHDDFGTLDLTASYNLTENFTLRFAATNLLEEDSIQYAAADADNEATKISLKDGYPAWSYQGEATYAIGVDFRF